MAKTKVGDKKVFSAHVASVNENGVTNTLIVNTDKPIIGMNKEFTAEEEHLYFHASVTMLLSHLEGVKGRYVRFKVGNAPHKYEGVTSVLCMLYDNSDIEIERTYIAKGTDINGVKAAHDMWHTSDLKVTFPKLTAEDNELLAMLINDIKPKSQAQVKPLF